MDEIDRFFSMVGERRHVKLLERASGTVLVELKEGTKTRRWYVAVQHGDLSVSRRGGKADCTIRTQAETFKAILEGRVNAPAAMLRGLLEVDGKIQLLVALQALFRPSSGSAEQAVAGYAKELS